MGTPAGPHIVVAGSSNTDLVIACGRLPRPGETLLGGAFERHAGGKGANQAVAAARAGAKVTFIGACGDDDFGRAARASLQREGIDTRYFRTDRSGNPSGVALIFIGGKEKQNLIAVARSANNTVNIQDVQRARSILARCDAVIGSLEIPLAVIREAADIATEHGIPFILNPAPARPLADAMLKKVFALTPNVSELKVLAPECRGPREAAESLLDRGCRHVVVTLGSKGALVVDAKGARRILGRRVRPVDTVGAGDCFTAWLAMGIAKGLEVAEAARWANAAAAIAVTRPGAQAGMPFAREVSI